MKVLNIEKYIFLLFLFIGLSLVTFNIIGFNFKYFPGDLGDARFNIYILENAHKFITAQSNSLWNAPFMYPEENVITFSDNLLGSVPFYSIFRLFNFDLETSFQLWYLVVTALNYLCAYFFLKWLFKNNFAAILGAFIFAFSIALQSQIGHAQTFPRFPIPLLFWMSLLFFKDFKPKYFFLSLIFLVYQFYCGIYLGFLLFIPAAIIYILIFVINVKKIINKFKNIKWLLLMGISVIINFLLLLPLMIPYYERSKKTGYTEYSNLFYSIPTLKSFVFSYPGSIFWEFLNSTCNKYPAFWNHEIFVGGLALSCLFISFVLILINLFKKNLFNFFDLNKEILIIFLTGFLTFIFFIRIGNFSLYKLIYKVPGYGALRDLTRIINIELIFFSVAVSFVYALIVKNKNSYYKIFIFLLIFAIGIIDNYMKGSATFRTEKIISQNRMFNLKKELTGLKEGSIFSYEPTEIIGNSIFYNIDAMLVSQELSLKTVNGYSGTSPNGYSNYWKSPNSENRLLYFKTQNFYPDTIYVTSCNKPIFIETKKNRIYIQNPKIIENIINGIKSNADWLKSVKIKAKNKGISLDSMLKLDAIWVLNQKNK